MSPQAVDRPSLTAAAGGDGVRRLSAVPYPQYASSSSATGTRAGAGDVVTPPQRSISLGGASHSDVTFVVEGRHVRLHRAILSARCDYFRSECLPVGCAACVVLRCGVVLCGVLCAVCCTPASCV